MSSILESYGSPDKPGYFLLGNVALELSVEDIQISRVENDEEVMTLRAKYPTLLKTGTSRIDVTISWKALGLPQWEDVRSIVTLFRACPFLVVENSHIRKYLASLDDSFSQAAMGFALRQMRIQTLEDLIDTLECSLTMTLFNYLPYTPTMKYLGDDGSPVDPLDSDAFVAYTSAWKAANLDRQPTEFTVAPWQEQTDSSSQVSYRRYKVSVDLPAKDAKGMFVTTPVLTQKEVDDGWTLDYYTSDAKFLYQNLSLSIGGDGLGVDDAFVSNVTVVLSNNLAQIPLSGFQYPTYQHIGPSVTNVSLGLHFANSDSGTLDAINTAIDTVNRQFLAVRSISRRVDSIYRMQALYVENQILNMLGIFSIQPKNLFTETVPEADMVQGQLVGIHYQNYYEILTGYKIRSPAQDHLDALQSISDPKNLGAITPEDAKVMQSLMTFYAARTSHSIAYLGKYLTLDAKGMAVAASLPQIAMPALGILEAQALKNLAVAKNATGASVASLFPALGSRTSLGSTLSFTDAAILMAVHDAQGLTPVQGFYSFAESYRSATTQVNSWAASQTPNPYDALYDQLFRTLYISDPSFTAAVEQAAKSPTVSAALKQIGQIQGPGSDPNNSDHGAYMDLGIPSVNLSGADFNPAMYFYDYQSTVFQTMWGNLEGHNQVLGNLLNDCLSPTFILNKTDNPAASPSPASDTTLLSYSADSGIGPGNAFGIMIRSNVPGFSLKEAFPTFKLFLLEDDNQDTFYGFDNFYSYSSVAEIEVIRRDDSDDEALIRITNLAGLLNHRLYDNSAQGKQERADDLGAVGPLSNEALTNAGSSRSNSAGRTPQGFDYQDGYNGQQTPLKYYSLQTGSKIQIRMGFENNPDNLWPVFNGVITALSEEKDVMTIAAQGYILELLKPSDDDMKTNGFHLTSSLSEEAYDIQEVFVDSTSSAFFPFHARFWSDLWSAVPFPKKSKAYGGMAIFGSNGTADFVLRDMLKVSGAKHFGHWQINAQGDKFLKGFRWDDTLAKVVNAGISVVGGSLTLGSIYDRSGDNILVNSFLNADGSQTAGGHNDTHRTWDIENRFALPATYSIPKEDNKRPVWDFIKDISRRYPDYILAVKPYGFPFGADATLVYAQPNDWYRSRDVLPGDYEFAQPKDLTDGNAFATWWKSAGSQKFLNEVAPIAVEVNTDRGRYLRDALSLSTAALVTDGVTERAKLDRNPSYEEFVRYINELLRLIKSLYGGADAFNRGGLLPGFLSTRGNDFRNTLSNNMREASNFIQSTKSGTLLTASPDRSLEPVQRYHFIDSNSIINNGLEVNGSIYNTVKVGNNTYCANDFIPAHHRRLLDCNPMIIDPGSNVEPESLAPIRRSVAASFLKEEVEKMYRGEILLRGIPEIEPNDILMLHDTATGIVGPVKVGTVIHSFSQEMGYITICKPKALVLVNQTFTLKALASLQVSWRSAAADVAHAQGIWDSLYRSSKIEAGIIAAPAVAAAGVITLIDKATTGSTVFGNMSAMTEVATIAAGLMSLIAGSAELTPLIVCPVSRYGRPWMGGLEGYVMGGMLANIANKLKRFNEDNISPLIESWKTGVAFLHPSMQTALAPSPTSRGVSSVGTKTLSQQGLSLIEREEGLRLKTYNDSVGNPTIGYGHLLRPGESFPTGITQAQAQALLANDVKTAERIVNSYVKAPLTQGQFDALVDVAYNVGHLGSTLLKLVNAGNLTQVPAAIMALDTAKGVVLTGLVNRRRADVALWNS